MFSTSCAISRRTIEALPFPTGLTSELRQPSAATTLILTFSLREKELSLPLGEKDATAPSEGTKCEHLRGIIGAAQATTAAVVAGAPRRLRYGFILPMAESSKSIAPEIQVSM